MSFIENKISDPSLDLKEYLREYERSIKDPEDFWNDKASSINWIKKFSKIKESSFNDDVSIKWFSDGSLNVSENCIDRHLKERGDKIAIIWQGDEPEDSKKITYRELHKEVCKLANGLKSLGVKKGDRVTIYLPMIPEAAYAMLACSRIGAIHSVVFGGFAPDSLKDRVIDCSSSTIITANEGLEEERKFLYFQMLEKLFKV